MNIGFKRLLKSLAGRIKAASLFVKLIILSTSVIFISMLVALIFTVPSLYSRSDMEATSGFADVDIVDGVPARIRFECLGKEYKTPDDLKKIKKEDRFTYKDYVFNKKEFGFLKKNGFFVKPLDLDQLYYPKHDEWGITSLRYDDMIDLYLRYSRIMKPVEFYTGSEGDAPVYNLAPYFISADYMLHIFHLMFMRMMQNVEEKKFYPAVRDLTDSMLKEAVSLYKNTSDPRLKDEFKKTAAFLLVPARLMELTPPEKLPELEQLAASDFKMIMQEAGTARSAITGMDEDYSQYKPRGYYTLTENLSKYFKVMMWYGRMNFPEDKPVIPVIISSMLSKSDNLKKWESIYITTGYLIGKSEDFTIYQYQDIMKKVFGSTKMITSYPDQNKLQKFAAELKKLPAPRISNVPLGTKADKNDPAKNLEMQRGFRFMGQRFVPDAYIFSRLTSRNVGNDQSPRNTPKALDVMAVLGSREAESLLKDDFKNIPKYQSEYQILKDEFSKYGDDVWSQNAYYGWLHTFITLFDKADENLPYAFKTDEWKHRLLLTTHGSWAELKHDTLLYTKQSYGEAGGEGETRYFPGQPYIPHGYVEPNVRFFESISRLSAQIRKKLGASGMMTDQYEKRFSEYEKITERLKSIAKQQINREKISDDDFLFIAEFNKSTGFLILPEDTDYSAMTEKDKQMALVSDVHTDNFFNTVLEAGIGIPQQLYVVISDRNGLRVCVGYIYSYYEFKNPQNERLTDDDWKKKVYQPGAWKILKSLEPKWLEKLPFSD